MKKDKRKAIYDSIIILNKDTTLDVVSENKFCDIYHKKKVKCALFPVGEHKNEYVKVNIDDIPFGFKKIIVDYKLCLQFFVDPEASYETIYDNSIEIKDLLSLYRFVHSIYNIQGVNTFINTEVFDEFMEFIIDDFIITIEYPNGKIVRNDTREISSKEAYPYMNSTYCSTDTHTPYILSLLDLSFYGKHYKDHTLIRGSNKDENIAIDLDKKIWYKISNRNTVYKNLSLTRDDMTNTVLQTIDCNNFNSYVFIHPEDFMIIDRYVRTITMTFFEYTIDNRYDLPADFNYSFESICDSPLCEIIYDNSMNIYESVNLIELVAHLSYFTKTLLILFDKIYGTLGTFGMDIQMTFKDNSQLTYPVTNNEIYNGKNFYDEFIECVRSHISERGKMK